MLSVVLVRRFGEFDHLLVKAIRGTDVEGDHRSIGLVRRRDLRDAIVNVSSKPISVCRPGRSATDQKNDQSTGKSEQHVMKCGVVANAVGTALHLIKSSTSFS